MQNLNIIFFKIMKKIQLQIKSTKKKNLNLLLVISNGLLLVLKVFKIIYNFCVHKLFINFLTPNSCMKEGLSKVVINFLLSKSLLPFSTEIFNDKK
jgi:hypothetical protein